MIWLATFGLAPCVYYSLEVFYETYIKSKPKGKRA